ncbi:MAG: class I SAM-dependent methyltransferase [Candidatus Edwardsbacteria bacterium]|nr:class I SAM-dependent methyltransferase [Candidatus Edwardsbacteria bacterium]
MKILMPADIPDYSLLDSGQGEKLESWSGYIIRRPDPNAVWSRRRPEAEWQKADAVFHKSTGAQRPAPVAKNWTVHRPPPEQWRFRYQDLWFDLQLTPFKHTGVFPEQAANWEWFSHLICNSTSQPALLNLFGYTGAATLAAAAAGARVCHVDASKPAVDWAGRNQRLSGLADKPVRWILDDCVKFVARERKRGARYDAIIMDPPAFGRDPKGRVFKFEDDVPRLLQSCRDILAGRPLFFLINGYSMGYSATVLKNMLAGILPIERIECGELHLPESDGPRTLPCSVFARYCAEAGR